jgi:photosystem II stability/assembly factor-like uncharacterized protein
MMKILGRILSTGAVFSVASLMMFPAIAAAQRAQGAAPATYADREAAWQKHQQLMDTSLTRGLDWRSVGPVVQGGRVADIETVPGEPYTFYVAYSSGGLWKTTNNGVTFEPIFDHESTNIIGDVAVDPSNPETVWLGTGEPNSSRSSYAGMGIFRSDDGGSTWRQTGLDNSDRVGRVLVDPRDSDRVFVAVLGKLYTPGGERGIYRTADGGTSWSQVLAGDEVTGFVDLVMDPSNPDVLYAAAWQRARRPWEFTEGGPGSAIWKTTDGGETWNRLDGGFPHGEHVGRIGLSIAESQPQTIYAALDNQEQLPETMWDLGDGAITAKRLRTMSKQDFLEQDPEEVEDFIRNNDLDSSLTAKKLTRMVENDEITMQELIDEIQDANANLFNTDIRGIEVWRSDDGGGTWRLTHDEPIRQMVYTYGYYFGQIRVSPTDPDRIYILGVPILTSADGGATYESINHPDVHVDHHALWVDPNFSDRLFLGNDGGIDVSYDGGRSWLKLDAQPVGQFYAIAVDDAKPFNIYGGLQDNGSLRGSSRTRWDLGERWTEIGGGDGMYVQVDPRDRSTFYAGYQFGFYDRTEDGKKTRVRPRDKLKEPALRYNWQTPIVLSSHNADILYFGANQLFRSMDRGDRWEAISPDLTRNQNRGDVPFATIATLAESKLSFGLLWVGTDDGYVHVSPDGGVTWNDVSAGLPADRWVSRVEPSPHVRERAYVTLNGYRDDDSTAYLYRTDDLGQSWTSLAAGLPADALNVVREDPVNPDVLYVGSDRSVYVSLDAGKSWQGIGSGLPTVPVHDLIVHPRDRELVAGTHGRSAWVIDALPIQELTPDLMGQNAHLFPVEEVEFKRSWRKRRRPWRHDASAARDPEISLPFWAKSDGSATLEILDDGGRVLRRLEMEADRGVSAFSWDLLLDADLAVSAETDRLGEEQRNANRDDDSSDGQRAKTPWAESLRLERPLFITPGSYKLKLATAGGSSETDLVVEEPEDREPRDKPEPKIRGQKDDD